MSNKRFAFIMDLDTAQEFFQRCIDREAVTAKERNTILFELHQEKKSEYLGHTESTDQELVNDLNASGVKAVGVRKQRRKS